MKNALHEMNPAVKFLVITLSILTLAFFFNPWTPFLFWAGVLVLQIFFSKINWKLWLIVMFPFAVGAIGYLWTTVVFGAEIGGVVIWTFAGFEVTDEQWARALSLAFRVMAFSSLSLMFAFTTDPVRFIMSLMQQLKLSPKLAYGVLVGYQFLPVLQSEFIQIRQAHRLRGVDEGKYWWQRILNVRRLLIPMLAGSVRKAERAAFAMEARGFTGEARSSFYKPVRMRGIDAVMSVIFLLLLAGSCLGGYWLS